MAAHIPSNPFILVDGSSYLFRAYHALPPLVSTKGQPTGAIYGVVNMLRRLIKDYKPEKMAVIFDSKQKNFRHELYESYKANRTVMADDLQTQIEPLFALIKAMGLPLISLPGIEADDIIGTLAKEAKAQGLFTLISTGDKDFAQIVDDQVFLINTMSQEIYDRARVIEKFEVPPEKITEYFALIGDSVDNIPGIPQVGPKTAVKWLQTHGSLQAIVDNAHAITGKVGEKLRENIELIPLFKQLVTIDCNLSLDFPLESLKIAPADDITLKHIYTELEFKTWLRDLMIEKTSQDSDQPISVKEGLNETQASPIKDLAVDIILEDKQLQVWLKELKAAKSFVLELKTTHLEDMFAGIVGIGVAIDVNHAAYIPLAHQYDAAPKQLTLDKTLEKLRPLLEDHTLLKIGHHLKYVAEVLANHGISLGGIAYDVMLESYVLNSTITRHDLDALANYHLGMTKISYKELAGKGAKQINFDQVEVEKAAQFAANDAVIILRLHEYLWSQLAQHPKLVNIYETIELPLLSVLMHMERTGVLIDSELLKKQSEELSLRCALLEKEAHQLAQQSFNLNSPKQLQEILFNQLKLPIMEKTPTGQPSTGESVLQALAQEYPLPKIILEYRSLSKLKSTYTDTLPQQVAPTTGRIHTCYHQAITSTGRLSSTDPNLQNIPIRTAEGRRVRCAFKASPGYKIVAADYSQIELRIMAHMSQDVGLIKAFAAEDDIHQSTAAEVFQVSLEQVSPEQRRSAKIINFGLMYGMSAFGLSRQLGLERSQAEKQIERYFACFPGVKSMMNQVLETAKEKGYVETLLGRRLYLPELTASNMARRKAAERAGINAPMQGTNADIIKLAMIEVHHLTVKMQDKMRMIMQVHDELVFEISEDVLDDIIPKIKAIMENVLPLSVKLRVEVGIGNNWEEAHRM